MMQYKIVVGKDVYTLSKAVNDHIKKGWIPQGGVSSSFGVGKISIYRQAMIKEGDQ